MRINCVLFFSICFLTIGSVKGQVCRSHIPFCVDIARHLSSDEFTMMRDFVLNPFLSLLPTDIRPNLYCEFSNGAHVWYPRTVQDIGYSVELLEQNNLFESYFISSLEALYAHHSLNYSAAAGVPQNIVIFTGGSLHDQYVHEAANATNLLTANGNTITVVFVKSDVDQTNYQRIPQLKLVQWSDDSDVLFANIRKNMNCLASTTPASGSTTLPTVSSCKSHIPFGIDISTDLTSQQFTMMKNFVLNPFLSQLFPQDIRPNLYCFFYEGAQVFYPQKVSDIVQVINSSARQNFGQSEGYFISPISYLEFYHVLNYSAAAGVPQNLVVFTGGPLHDRYFQDAVNYTTKLTANGNTVIVVFVKPNMNLTNYQRISQLKLVQWSNDSSVLLSNIRKNMNCLAATTPAGSTTPPMVSSCKSHIPFAYDVSKSLTADQYTFEEQLILDPFLTTLFSSTVQPSWFGIFDTSAYFPKSRPNNINDIASFVKLYPQLSGKTGNLDVVLKQLLARNVTSNNDSLPVNTVIFTGSDLPLNDFETTVLLVNEFTKPNNTLTIVFTNPNINQQNYQAVVLVSNVKLVQYNSNKLQMVADLRQAMNCN